MPTELEKAYLAGIIDGEGCIGATSVHDKRRNRSPSVMFTVFVAMTDLQVPNMFFQLYGGSLRHTEDLRGGRRTMHIWQGYGETGAKLLRDILPYLRIKAPQAEIYLEARMTFTGGPKLGVQGSVSPTANDLAKRFDCLHKIQQLNRRETNANAQ